MTTFTVDSTALFTLVAISAGVGFLVGLAMVIFRRGKRDSKPPQKGLFEVARIWRDKFDGKLWLQIEENSGSRLDDFSGDDRDQAEKIVNGLANWIERPDTLPAAIPVAVTQGAATPVAAALTAAAFAAQIGTEQRTGPSAAATTPEDSPVGAVRDEQGSIPPPIPQPLAPVQSSPPVVENQQSANRPRIDIVKGIRLTLEGDAASKLEKAQNRSIAAQVDEILQEKIKGTVLEQKAIRLMELPGKGMVVMVGMEQYDSLDAVPYPEVKAAIRYCVAQWEKKMLG